jgi:hypothetical protein
MFSYYYETQIAHIFCSAPLPPQKKKACKTIENIQIIRLKIEEFSPKKCSLRNANIIVFV